MLLQMLCCIAHSLLKNTIISKILVAIFNDTFAFITSCVPVQQALHVLITTEL